MSDSLREKTLFELALERGDAAGLSGVDGSGNEWEIPQNIGDTSGDMDKIAFIESEE